jgi:hypothetical protein
MFNNNIPPVWTIGAVAAGTAIIYKSLRSRMSLTKKITFCALGTLSIGVGVMGYLNWNTMNVRNVCMEKFIEKHNELSDYCTEPVNQDKEIQSLDTSSIFRLLYNKVHYCVRYFYGDIGTVFCKCTTKYIDEYKQILFFRGHQGHQFKEILSDTYENSSSIEDCVCEQSNC